MLVPKLWGDWDWGLSFRCREESDVGKSDDGHHPSQRAIGNSPGDAHALQACHAASPHQVVAVQFSFWPPMRCLGMSRAGTVWSGEVHGAMFRWGLQLKPSRGLRRIHVCGEHVNAAAQGRKFRGDSIVATFVFGLVEKIIAYLLTGL